MGGVRLWQNLRRSAGRKNKRSLILTLMVSFALLASYNEPRISHRVNTQEITPVLLLEALRGSSTSRVSDSVASH